MTLNTHQLHVEILHLGESHVASVHEHLDLCLRAAARGDAEVEIASFLNSKMSIVPVLLVL